MHYGSGLSGVTSERVKKDLAPILSFDQRSATQTYSETLPPEVAGGDHRIRK